MELIGEIQEDLIKESAKLANTLRKAMVLAHKIRSPELQEWARAELDGYPYEDKDKVPPYRRINLPVQGEFRGPLGFRQTDLQIPTSGLPEEIRDIVDTEVMLDGVSVLEGLIEESFQTGRPPVRPLPLEVTELLRGHVSMTQGGVLFQAYQKVPSQYIVGVLDSVKTKLLELVLALQGNSVTPEAVASGEVATEVVRNIFNVTINGDNNKVATGENVHQEVKTVQKGDLNSLMKHLRAHNVSDEDLQDLEEAISSEPDGVNGDFGSKVNAWVGNMMTKAVSGEWPVMVEKAADVVVKSLKSYLGI